MDSSAKAVLASLELPPHVLLLLEFYGIRTLKDLTMIDSTTIAEVADTVKDGSLGDVVDLTLKANRMKYLGCDHTNLASFKFKPMDLKKLVQVSTFANQALKITAEKQRGEDDKKLAKKVTRLIGSQASSTASTSDGISVDELEVVKDSNEAQAEESVDKLKR